MSEARPSPPRPAGWTRSLPEHLPRPTPRPALFAFGVTLFVWGIVASPLLMLIGGATLAHSLLHWIWEIRNDAR